MALTAPFNLFPGFPGWTTGFDLHWRQEQSTQASGRTVVKDLGAPLWTCRATTKTLSPNNLDYWRARLTALENGMQQFWGYPMSRCYPILYPNGSWPTGAAFNGNCLLASISSDRRSISLSNLPAGFVLSVGDYVSIGPGDLHQVMETATASGGGTTGVFEVRPQVWPNRTAPAVVSVKQPACLMSLVPGSLSSEAQINGWGAVSFQAMEARGSTLVSGGTVVVPARGSATAIGSASAASLVKIVAAGAAAGQATVAATGGTAAPPSPGPEASAFLARTSGLDATHTNAYTNLINGLVADAVWSKLDLLHIYATQNSTTALLNLVSTSYNGTANGSPTFTVDRGFTGTDGSATVYINTGFNAATASSPKFVQNSAHLSVWNVTNPGGGMNGAAMGTATPSSGAGNLIQPQSTTGNCALKANCNGQIDAIAGSGTGHHVANRSGPNARDGYRNGVNIQSITSGANSGSIAVQNGNIYAIGHNNLDTPVPVGSGFQLAMISIGSSLSPTDVTFFYNRLRTYMTAVGVP